MVIQKLTLIEIKKFRAACAFILLSCDFKREYLESIKITPVYKLEVQCQHLKDSIMSRVSVG